PVERLVCANDALAAQDAELSAVFRESREGKDDAARSALLQDQRHCLKARLTSCNIPAKGDVAADQHPAAIRCLSDQYTARIAALKPQPKDTTQAPATTAAPT